MTLNPSTRLASLRMTAAMILSGSIGFFVVETGQAATTVVFWRCVFGALVIAAYAIATGRFAGSVLTRRALGLMMLSGATMAANWVFFFMAYDHAPISTVTIVYHLYPFILILAAGVLFGEAVRRLSLAWAALAFMGVVVIALGSSGDTGIDLIGIGLTAIAMIFYAATLLIAKRLHDQSPELTSAVQLLVGAVILLPFQTFPDVGIGAGTWGYLLTLGVIHTGLLYVLLYGAVQKLETSTVALLSFLYPATALGFDILIFGVRPGPIQISGIVMILVAVLAERSGCLRWRDHPLRRLGGQIHTPYSSRQKPRSNQETPTHPVDHT